MAWRDPETRLRAVRLFVMGAGLVAATTMVLVSLDRRTYFSYHHDYAVRWGHPTTVVVLVALATVAESAAACFVVGSTQLRRLWRRGLAALVVLMPLAFLASMFVVHSPGFWMLHVLWVWLLVACVALGTLASGALHAHSLLRARVGGRRADAR